MADIFRPKAQQTQLSAGDKAAEASADRERLDALREQAQARTAQLMRVFGSRSSLGGGGLGF